MADKFVLGVGQAHELEMAMNRVGGWNAALVKRMCEGDRFAHIREYLLNLAEIKTAEHVIDCDAAPFVPQGWKVEEHQRGGSLKWDPRQVQFYLSPEQQNGKATRGEKLRKELAGKPVLNANVLDYLLAHPHLIPEEWKKDEQNRTRYIFFWGTIYRDPHGNLFVRYLDWVDGRWDWLCSWLGHGWVGRYPAALLAVGK